LIAALLALVLSDPRTPLVGPGGFTCPTGQAIQMITGTRDRGRCVAVAGGSMTSLHFVTTQSESGLSAETVLPTCTGTQRLTWSGSALTCADSVLSATSSVTGGLRLTGQLGGSATSPTVIGVTGAVVGVANLNTTGTPDSTTFLRGDGQWSTPSAGVSAGGYETATISSTPTTITPSGTKSVINISQSVSGDWTLANPSAHADGQMLTIAYRKTATFSNPTVTLGSEYAIGGIGLPVTYSSGNYGAVIVQFFDGKWREVGRPGSGGITY
jgi:hypothetical protein